MVACMAFSAACSERTCHGPAASERPRTNSRDENP
jgi:hypothetical protein